MSVVKKLGNMFDRAPQEAHAVSSAGTLTIRSAALPDDEAEAVDLGDLRDPFQSEQFNSVQSDPGARTGQPWPDAEAGGMLDMVTLPVLGQAPAGTQQKRLLALLAAGVLALALIAGWVLQQVDRGAQQLAATGQTLMQSQRLAKSVPSCPSWKVPSAMPPW